MTGCLQLLVASGAPLSMGITPVAINASQTNGTAYSGSASANASGGSGSYSYAWSWLSGGTLININNPALATTGLGSAAASNLTRSGTLQCIVTDTVTGQTVSGTISVTITWGAV